MDSSRIEEALERALAQPRSVEVDGQKVENHSLQELVAADRYVASKRALAARRCPLRVAKMVAGGAA